MDFKGKILFQVFNDHHQKGQLDAERFLWIGRCADVRGGDVGAFDLEHQRLDVIVSYAFNVPIAHFLIPDLQRLRANTVKDRQKATLLNKLLQKLDKFGIYLESVFEHGGGESLVTRTLTGAFGE